MKDYVKEYKGYKVPEGATHAKEVGKNSVLFQMMINHPTAKMFSDLDNSWVDCLGVPAASDELPLATEQPMPTKTEWMPSVGEECEVLDMCYAHPKSSKAKVKGFYGDQVWLTLPSGEDRVVLIANCEFNPLKTAEEKKREAFIEKSMNLIETTYSSSEALRLAAEMAGLQFDSGFTAPEGEV